MVETRVAETRVKCELAVGAVVTSEAHAAVGSVAQIFANAAIFARIARAWLIGRLAVDAVVTWQTRAVVEIGR